MLSTSLLISLVIVGITFILVKIHDSGLLKRFKLRKIIEFKYKTKVEFHLEIKLAGSNIYIFKNPMTAYYIDEFGQICGIKNMGDD